MYYPRCRTRLKVEVSRILWQLELRSQCDATVSELERVCDAFCLTGSHERQRRQQLLYSVHELSLNI